MSPIRTHLECPLCGTPAIECSRWDMRTGPTWTEDDEADCPGCGVHLVVFITGDEDGDYVEAKVEGEES